MKSELLTRDQFRERCLARDRNMCVICGDTNDLSVHHIIERRLFSDGGYYMDNGATLCEKHHILAETTQLSCERIREEAGITTTRIPYDYYSDVRYSKWGDVMLSNGTRMKGPLFDDESVQKILKIGDVLPFYTDYVKYPRSWHLPWSEGQTKDDRTLENCDQFVDKRVIITEKMDGENTTIYRDYIHARSIDGNTHWSQSWVRNLQGRIGYEIPEGWRICGENLYAKHSIGYDNLDSFFAVFSIWTDKNVCLSWQDTVEYCDILNLRMVPVLYDGIWDEKFTRSLWDEKRRDVTEGYVVRLADSYSYFDFNKSLAKFVRSNHVAKENHHWKFTATEKNRLISVTD
jgi:hypothetical protein